MQHFCPLEASPFPQALSPLCGQQNLLWPCGAAVLAAGGGFFSSPLGCLPPPPPCPFSLAARVPACGALADAVPLEPEVLPELRPKTLPPPSLELQHRGCESRCSLR